MSAAYRTETITLLANDAIEAENGSYPQAAMLLFDAALSILVTRHTNTAARRELGSMFAEYIREQVEAVIAAGGDA